MNGPLEVLNDVIKRLDRVNVPYFLVGSLAAMFYSRPRFTNDIDLVLQIRAEQILSFENIFNIEDYYCPPTEVLKDEVLRTGMFNLIHQESGIKIDVVLLKKTEFYESEFKRRQKVEITPGNFIYIATAEDIIIKKLDFYREGGSEKHIQDISEILAETAIDKDYIQKWVDHFGLNLQWDKARS